MKAVAQAAIVCALAPLALVLLVLCALCAAIVDNREWNDV